MEPDLEIYRKLLTVPWFAKCGRQTSLFRFSVHRVETSAEAITAAQSDLWADAKTEAQGDLTAFLAKHHYNEFADWNRLGTLIRSHIHTEISPRISDALAKISAGTLYNTVMLDLNRIALHSTYAKRFRHVPDFFSKLFVVYEAGHLPCGWRGDLEEWPNGELMIF